MIVWFCDYDKKVTRFKDTWWLIVLFAVDFPGFDYVNIDYWLCIYNMVFCLHSNKWLGCSDHKAARTLSKATQQVRWIPTRDTAAIRARGGGAARFTIFPVANSVFATVGGAATPSRAHAHRTISRPKHAEKYTPTHETRNSSKRSEPTN